MRSVYFVLFLIVVSCSSEKEWNAQESCNTIFSPDEGQFRKFEIGMSKTAFDAAYTGNAIYANPNEVVDSLTVSEEIYCETAFQFYNNYLSEIIVRIEISDESKKNQLLETIIQKLKADYGDFLKERDYYYWRIEGSTLTTDVYLREPEIKKGDNDKKFVISLYFTVGSEVS